MPIQRTAHPERSEVDLLSPTYTLPASAHIGRVRLAVSDLERSVGFYRDVIGFAVLTRSSSLAQLGTKDGGLGESVLLELEEQPGVKPISPRSRLGLYHTAFLLPSREALSSFVRHLWRLKVPFGAGDHLVSEALYLVDPDGLEVEVYADRPRDQWQRVGSEIKMGTWPVRFETLPPVAEDSWKGAPAGTTIGHMHFYVGDVDAAADFYCAGLGLDVMVRMPSAIFVSAGGYHHHVGLNVWAAGSPVASQQDARLLHWELVLPDEEEVARAAGSLAAAGYSETLYSGPSKTFTDPWGISAALVSEHV